MIQAEYAYGTAFITGKILKPRKTKATVALQVFVIGVYCGYWKNRE